MPNSSPAISSVSTLQTVKSLLIKLIALAQRYPGLIAIFGFISGAASFFFVERSTSIAQGITIVLLLSWLFLILEKVLRDLLLRYFHLSFPPAVMHYLTQLVHQESLFFALPFFLAVTTWDHGQSVFTALLIICALVSVIDPVYYQKLAKRRELFLLFHAFALFSVMLVSLPVILQMTTTQSIAWALLTVIALSLPSLVRVFQYRRWWRLPALLLMLSVLAGALWQARGWIPPASLRLTEMSLSQEVDRQQLQHGQAINSISQTQLKQSGLYAWTAIKAPRGLQEKIHHVWVHNGKQVDRITLEINGGRELGYRAFSYKSHFPEQSAGRWQVKVVTDSGQLVGLKRFNVTN
ncbi:DUF5924 family protein [Methylophaga sp. OBS3]|uniref:DUF5924 family protein n=1 Tax=Methylophaga sp. OBS3 TaxID=2991934 RepID=UPI00225B6733|nr:DUF5924 family protein [Methylophaga sp. OBS3]MCX4189843.1 DUF2914 domain-containing protein [Methylophaga sp. OBS3]